MKLLACLCALLLGPAAASPPHQAGCCGADAPRPSQERQIRLPDGFGIALEPKLFFNLWDTEEAGKMRLQSRVEFRFTPPAGATGRQARQLMERGTLFSSLQAGFAQFGLDGAACLQRAVCETAATPHHSDGLLGDMVTLALSPSREPVTDAPAAPLEPLLEAETRGWRHGSDGCSAYYERCPVSLFNVKAGAEDFTGAILDFVKGRAPAET